MPPREHSWKNRFRVWTQNVTAGCVIALDTLDFKNKGKLRKGADSTPIWMFE